MTTESSQSRWRDWRVLAIAVIVALLALLVALYVVTAPRGTESNGDAGRLSHFAQGVDDVMLLDSSGETVRWADLNGRPRLVFFGFTRCPEICPTTVADLSAAIDALGPAAGNIEVDFISVDPARDTPEHLALYFQSFGPRFRGFTGERAEIDRLVASFRAFYEYVPAEGEDYTVNHTAITYLINPYGEVVDIIGYGNPHERTVAQLRAFLS
jgi:protein SCO1/2